jgi:16S rRNA (guanine966-N2)-methyltransferase
MRVVAGTAGGRRLRTPSADDVRPTSDRVREATFNALGSLGAIIDRAVLDLFAGTGALGIEALSRGAKEAVFVEEARAAQVVIDANLAATGLADRAEIVRGDALQYIQGRPARFGLVLLDPPYRFAGWSALLGDLPAVLSPDAVVVIESDRRIDLPAGWRVEREKRYGSTFVAIVRPPEPLRPSQPEQR